MDKTEIRPRLSKGLSSKVFREYYYLKEELAAFCRGNSLPVTGSKQELTDRTVFFLDTGKTQPPAAKRTVTPGKPVSDITRASIIEDGFVCTETHRAFFEKEIGSSFSFNVRFQQWLKANAGKTYGDAIAAYDRILQKKRPKRVPSDSSSNTIPISGIFSQTTQGKRLLTRSGVGSTRRV